MYAGEGIVTFHIFDLIDFAGQQLSNELPTMIRPSDIWDEGSWLYYVSEHIGRFSLY